MENNRFIVVMGWMMTTLGLNGNELLAYALIYGYSQEGAGAYFGSLAHTAEALNISRRAVSDVLDRLVQKGVIAKEQVEINGVRRCLYKAVVPDEAVPAPAPPTPAPSPSKPARPRFTPPTREEVAAYCEQIGCTIDVDRFCDYYEANGWVQGRGKPIKDWKATVRNWLRTEGYGQRNHQGSKEAALAQHRARLASEIAGIDARYRAQDSRGHDASGVPKEAQPGVGGCNT